MINVYIDPEIQELVVAQQWNALAAHPDLRRFPELVVEVATREFLALRDRVTNPPGNFDKAGRWYPDEYFPCCRNVRSPSRAWPYSELRHARTARHVAARFGVDESAVRKMARQIEKSESE